MKNHIPTCQSESLTGLPAIRHGFFTREGGGSAGLYASLNCRLGSDDDADAVAGNRRAVGAALGKTALVTAYQSHTPVAMVIDRPFDGVPPVADALVTATPGLVIGVLTADCAPVLFASRDGTIVSAAHAGWKGALHGVLENTIREMERLGAVRSGIVAAIGPCIAQASYEVGSEFRDAFTAMDGGYTAFFANSARPDHFQFDLPGFVRHRLQRAGIDVIDGLNLDTYTDEARFFSYRRATHRAEAGYGCQASAIAIG